MANESAVKVLRDAISQTLQYDIDTLVSRTDWGSINFAEAKSDLDRILGIANHLSLLPLENLTDQAVQQVSQALTQANEVLKRLDAFDLAEGVPTQIRTELINEVHGQADNLYTIATPWIPFLAYQKGDVAKNVAELTKSVQKANGLVEQAREEIEGKKAEIDGIVTTAREASASAGAAVFTRDFNEESIGLANKAKTWLIATGLLGGASLLFALALWFKPESTQNGWEAAHRFGARVLVLVILVTATLWCGRMYKALMHQSAVNRHRALALQTFQAFSAAASDDATKNAVLTETTRSIFSNSATGYIDEPNQAPTNLRLLELNRIVSPGPQ